MLKCLFHCLCQNIITFVLLLKESSAVWERQNLLVHLAPKTQEYHSDSIFCLRVDYTEKKNENKKE